MSLVRIGMSESKGYAEGYEAIFGKRPKGGAKPDGAEAKPAEKASGAAEAEGRAEKE